MFLRVQHEQPEGQSFVTVARLLGPDGGVISDAITSSVTVTVYDRDAELPATPILDETELGSPSEALTSALTVDGFWPYDSTGYNFLHIMTDSDIDPGFVQRGGHTYEFVYAIETAAYGTLKLSSVFYVVSA